MTRLISFGADADAVSVGPEIFRRLKKILPQYLSADGKSWFFKAEEGNPDAELALRLLHSWDVLLSNTSGPGFWCPHLGDFDVPAVEIFGDLQFDDKDLEKAELLSFEPALKFGEMYPYTEDVDFLKEKGVEMGWMDYGGSLWCATAAAIKKLEAWRDERIAAGKHHGLMILTETLRGRHRVWVIDVLTVMPPHVSPLRQHPGYENIPGFKQAIALYWRAGKGNCIPLSYRRKDLEARPDAGAPVACTWASDVGTGNRRLICHPDFYRWAVSAGFAFKWAPVEILEDDQQSQYVKPPVQDLITHLNTAPADQLRAELETLSARWPRPQPVEKPPAARKTGRRKKV